MREYLTKLRTDGFVEIKPGYVDAGAPPEKADQSIGSGRQKLTVSKWTQCVSTFS